MRRLFLPLATVVLALSCGPAHAAPATYQDPLPPVPFAHPNAYVNPFADPGWGPSRTDMGVDWVPSRPLPVLAIGDAVILGSDHHASWPGHRFIWYLLLDGSHAGDIVYVAENLRHLATAGTFVRAGQQIATALPSFPYTEWGWADTYGSPLAYPCYNRDGKRTMAGQEMARFLMELGAHVVDLPGPGPSAPQGKHCH